MKAVLQRVSKASVIVDKKTIAAIGSGLVILLGVDMDDTETDSTWLSHKIVNLRIFNDDNNVMNQSIQATNGDIIVVSQFTLCASTKKGHRPSYAKAAKPEVAMGRYQTFVKQLQEALGRPVQTGQFGAHMAVELINDGPVTILIDSKNKS